MYRLPTIAAVLALAACSSTPAAPAIASASDLASKAGCSSSYVAGSSQPGIKDGGKCTVDGETVYLYTFADDSARDNWLKIARGAGAIGTFGVGPAWVIQGLQDAPARSAGRGVQARCDAAHIGGAL